MVEVRVPATSANMGAGFDTMGIALGLYNIITVEEIESGLKIINRNTSEFIPTNENNLIYRALTRVFNEVGYSKKGIKIIQNSSIPMTRGLGSSSACIVGGLLAANVISKRQLSYERILEIATEMEGHADNVVPALYGGFCISACDNGRIYHRSYKLSPKLKYAVMVPDFYLPTKKSRRLLPKELPLKDASHNISRAVWFASSLATGKLDNLKIGVDDRIHQPYRKNCVDGMDEIFDESYKNGAKATFLSGSGPTVLSIIDNDYDAFCENMNLFFDEKALAWKCKIIGIDNVGSVVKS